MNNLTVDLETAKKLKEAGRKKKTYFTRVEGGKLGQEMKSELYLTRETNGRIVLADSAFNTYSSPTASELLDEFPREIRDKGQKFQSLLEIGFLDTGEGYVGYELIQSFPFNDNLANALAELWIRCKENGYLSFNNSDD